MARSGIFGDPRSPLKGTALTEALEKLGRLPEARARYEAYLKLLPDGPHAKEARKALDKLPAAVPEAARHQQAAGSAPAAGASKDKN